MASARGRGLESPCCWVTLSAINGRDPYLATVRRQFMAATPHTHQLFLRRLVALLIGLGGGRQRLRYTLS